MPLPHLTGVTDAPDVPGEAEIDSAPRTDPRGGGFPVGSLAYLPPRALTHSAWHEHIPFAFWLGEFCRPKVFVELGTHYGASYFAFCQAFAHLDLPVKAFAVDTWKGDQQAGFYDESVFKGVQKYNAQNYSGFSSLIRSTFDEAVQYFSDGEIDLLHIDGAHGYEDVARDFGVWRPKLSQDAIVLLHDTNVRERQFGVRPFFDELKRDFPSFEFVHGHGLGVICTGTPRGEALRALFAASGDAASEMHVRGVFSSLGRASSDAFKAHSFEAELQTLRKTVEEQKRRIGEQAKAAEAHEGRRIEALSKFESREVELRYAKSDNQRLGREVAAAKFAAQSAEDARAAFASDQIRQFEALTERETLLRQQAAQAEQRALQADSALAILTVEHRELRDQLTAKGRAADELGLEHRTLFVQLGEKERAFGELKAEHRTLLDGLGAKERRIEELAGLHRALSEQLVVKDGSIEASAQELRVLRDRLAEKDGAIAASAEELRELRDRLAEKDGSIAASAEELRTLRDQVAEKDASIEASAEELRTLRDQLAAKDGSIETVAEELRSLGERLAAKEGEVEALVARLADEGEREQQDSDGQLAAELAQTREDQAGLATRLLALEAELKIADDKRLEAERTLAATKTKSKEQASRQELKFRQETTELKRKTERLVREIATVSGLFLETESDIARLDRETRDQVEATIRAQVERAPRALAVRMGLGKPKRPVLDLRPLLDDVWYLQQYPDVAIAKMDPLTHYLEHGAAEGRSPNPVLFRSAELVRRCQQK